MEMELTRRTLIKMLGAGSLLAALPRAAAAALRERIFVWHNWSGSQSCIPTARVAPANEADLAATIRGAAAGTIRAVGTGHSFSPLVPTDGTLVSLGNLSGMIGHDAASMQSDWRAGTPMSEMGDPLKAAGLALINMSDIDYQTLGGACATSTHGTGVNYGSYSTQITGLRLITAKGEMLDCDQDHHPEIFDAARVSLGSLGIISRFRLQNRKAFRLHEKQWVQSTEELLEDMPRLIRENDHFELNPLVHADVSIATSTNPTDDTYDRPHPGGGDTKNADLMDMVQRYLKNAPGFRSSLTDFIAKHLIDFPEAVGDSYKVLAHVRNVRFFEMEYELPAEAGPACVREILKTIQDNNIPVWVPLEYRYVKRDDIPLSMFYGRDTCAISVHQYYQMDYHNYFSVIEPIFWKYEGRPHWGKLHTLNAAQLSKLYPRWKDFLAIRQELDPAGRFLNAHLRSVFGVRC
ncbi:MAG: D-arabinono-1,4-lactone oxidase [Stenotrophobium sp.]